MSTLDLIGSVAARRIRETTPVGSGRSFLFMIGLEAPIVSAIARHVALETFPPPSVEVFVHPLLQDGDVSPAIVSDVPAPWHRNHAGQGIALTVCTVAPHEIPALQPTLAHSSKIDEAWLLQSPSDWAIEGLCKCSDEIRNAFAIVLHGVIKAGVAHDPITIANFVVRVASHVVADGLILEKAVRRALPTLRLPKDSGDPRLKITESAENAKRFFDKVVEDARPALYLKGKDGEPLNRTEMKRRLEVFVKDQALESDAAKAIAGLLADKMVQDGKWTAAQSALAEMPWENIEPFFSDAKRKAKPNFGKETLDFFDRQFRGALTDDQKSLLNDLVKETIKPSEQIDEFFAQNRARLQTDQKLYKRWERLVFRAPLETDDLAKGLLLLANRAAPDGDDEQNGNIPRVLLIRLRGANQMDFWTKDKNARILRYLRDRYRGLAAMLAPATIFDCGLCWSENWEGLITEENTSQRKAHVELEFEAFVLPSADLQTALKNASGKPHANRAQLTWRPPAEAIGLSLSLDLRWIRPEDAAEGTRLMIGRIQQNKSGLAASTATINLANSASIMDAFGQNDGCLANPGRAEHRIDEIWPRSLADIRQQGILTPADADELKADFDTFHAAYGQAIEDLLRGQGVGSQSMFAQAEAYGRLLTKLAQKAPEEVCIRQLLAPLVNIGVIAIDSEQPAAIMTAWQPLRLAEIAAKAKQLVDAINLVVASTNGQRAGIEDFVNDRVARFSGTYYADIAIATLPSLDLDLLAETQSLADCSLLEVVSGSAQTSLTDEPAEAVVRAFDRVGDQYLALRPHEKANFSVVVLNADSENLPLAMANGLARRIENDADIRCDLVVTDDDPIRLRQTYERQNRRINHEIDVGLASEAARSFLSRLRVGIYSPDTISQENGLKTHDVVLLQDVVARSSKVRWTKGEAYDDDLNLADYMPTARSKRRPFRKGNTTSALYLTASKQPLPCRAYVDSLRTVMNRDVAQIKEPWLPIQEVEFLSGDVKDLLKKAHALGTWVMTFDRVADRRLIATDDRRIIKYFSVPGSTHNVIVSTEIAQEDFGGCLTSDLDVILPSLSHFELDSIKKEIYVRAAQLSGGVVMRGAQWSNYAQELLGLILTQRELDRLLRSGRDNKTAWFFLDDYREFLDLTGEMADILAVDFSIGPDGPAIRIVIAESKYVSADNHKDHRDRSERQLESTFTSFHHRLADDGKALDPSIWRNRLADMVLEHMEPFDQIGGITQHTWLEALRTGTYPIEVSGHSLVFSHELGAVFEPMPKLRDEEKPIVERRRLAQWVFSRSETAAALRDLGRDDATPLLSIPAGWPANTPLTVVPSPIATSPAGVDDSVRAASIDPAGASNDALLCSPPSEQPATPPIAVLKNERPENPDALLADGWPPAIARALARHSRANDEADALAWLQDKIVALRSALQTEGIDAPVLGHRLTPNTGLVYIGGQTLTVGWLERKQIDLMTRYGLEIVRITPMPGRIAIGLKRPSRSILHVADAWLRRTPPHSSNSAQRLSPLLGEKEDDGALCFLPLAIEFAGQEQAAPHTLISGATRSGKGILVTNLILDICALNSPAEIELYLIDPKKGMDYAWARRLPHLKGNIIDEKDAALDLMTKLVADMEARNKLIASEHCANIDQYNRKVSSARKMPRIVIFFDEVANWMQDDEFKSVIDAEINSIATTSRAAGFHLFMIYQRADNQVMTMQLRTNLGNKLILRLNDEGSSRIALNEKGAERLFGKGHMIAKLDSDDKIYLQVPYIGPDEVMDLAEAIIESWSKPKQEAAE